MRDNTLLLAVSLLLIGSTLVAAQDDTVKRKTGNSCKDDNECPDNAFCVKQVAGERGFCLCKQNHVITEYNSTHRECLKEATDVGQSCTAHLQCQAKLGLYAHCEDQVCRCKEKSHFEDGRCYQSSIIGERCTVSQSCYLGPDTDPSYQSYCVRGYCMCNLLHSPRDGGIRCLKDANLGDTCEDDEHCTGENERCNNVCRCKDGYVEHSEEKRCLKAATAMDEPCEVDSQCNKFLNNTACMGLKCSCQYNYHLQNGKCWLTKYEGEKCQNSNQCLTEENLKGNCYKGICVCPSCRSLPPGVPGSSSSVRGFLFITVLVSLTTIGVGVA